MVDAAESTVFEPPIAQVGPTMRAVQPQESRLPCIITEEYQVLTQEANRNRCASHWQLFLEGDRLPIAPHQIAARCARTGLGKTRMLLSGCHHCLLKSVRAHCW